MIYCIADTHFDDENIIKYESRPFTDVYDMNDSLIENINIIVKENDILYIIGDFGNANYAKDIIKRIICKNIYLIKGNHDIMHNDYYREIGFTEVYDKPIIIEDFCILSHEPLYMNTHMPYINIYGHVHNNPNYADYSKCGMCVCVERTNYKPISLENIIHFIKGADTSCEF